MIKQIPAFSISRLAKNLNMDIDIVEQLINQLKTMGYIKEEIINECCSKNCNGCLNSCKCVQIKVLYITEKGNKCLKRKITAQ